MSSALTAHDTDLQPDSRETTTRPAVHADAGQLDMPRAEAFADKMVQVLNHAGLAMMLSLGYRSGLFSVMAALPASTSQQIADAAGLQERYVREWLGAMVTSRVVSYEPETRRYALAPEHAAALTDDGAVGNLASMMQWIAVLGSVEDQVLDKFHNGGGVHYHCFHRFHEVMAADSAQTVVAALRDHILPMVDGLEAKLTAGIDVLDIGCGAGLAACKLAAMFPNSRFTGYDLCEDAIEAARRNAQERGLTNISFEARDVSALEGDGPFDLVTGFDVIHDQRDPAGVLDQVYAVLKPGGTFLMQDINASSHLENNIEHPLGTLFYTISTMHCMTVSLAQGGAGLGTAWGEELAVTMLADAGFVDITVNKLDHDIQNNYYVMVRPERLADDRN